jgi:hypothetical protein
MIDVMPLFDYLRAPDADAVQRLMDAGGGDTPAGTTRARG